MHAFALTRPSPMLAQNAGRYMLTPTRRTGGVECGLTTIMPPLSP